MTHCEARETSTEYLIAVDPPFEITKGRYAGGTIDSCNVWIHRPGDPWAYKVWVWGQVGDLRRIECRTVRSLEVTFPGLFDAVIVPVMSDPETNRAIQRW